MSELDHNGLVGSCSPSDCAACGGSCGKLDLTAVLHITTDEGESLACLPMLRFTNAEKTYIAVMPVRDFPKGDIYLYRLIGDASGLENIDDADEYSAAAAAFGQAMEEAEKLRG